MKIGITIPNYYSQYLDEIAKLNNSCKTAICSLIVENFLSYNKKQKKFPLFRKDVRIVFANEVPKSSVGNSGSDISSSDVHQDSEQPSLSRDEILKGLEDHQFVDVPEDPEDDGFPFQFDSED